MTAGASTGAVPPSALTTSHSDPALEGQLPTTVSGVQLSKFSVTLAELRVSSADRTTIDAFLGSIGKTESDASFASAYDPSGGVGGGVSAFKVSGANGGTLLAAIVALQSSDLGSGAVTKQSSVGGKTVTVVSVGTGPNDTVWVYGRGDTVYVVQAPAEATATPFITALP
jgi:hypothetical protein